MLLSDELWTDKINLSGWRPGSAGTRLVTGKVHIDEQTVLDEPNVPFGGVKDSGNGSRFGGASANIEAFTETQWVTARPEIASYPF